MGANTFSTTDILPIVIYTNITNIESLNRIKSDLRFSVSFLHQRQDGEESKETRNMNLQNLFSSNIVLFDSNKFDGFTGYDLANAQREKSYICDVQLDINVGFNRLHENGKRYLRSCTSYAFKELPHFISHINEMHERGNALPRILSTDEIRHKIDIINSIDVGYGEQYKKCPKLWGQEPAKSVVEASKIIREQFLVQDLSEVQCVDLGCGNGKNSGFLASEGFSVWGIDADINAIGQAKTDYCNQHLKFETGNILNLELPKNRFHIVVMTGSLHCLDSKQQIENIVEKAKKCHISRGIEYIIGLQWSRHVGL